MSQFDAFNRYDQQPCMNRVGGWKRRSCRTGKRWWDQETKATSLVKEVVAAVSNWQTHCSAVGVPGGTGREIEKTF